MSGKAGFTLIELMIVLAIIGILAVIAVPLYQSYVARSQVIEALMLMDAPRLQVYEDFSSGMPLSEMNSGVNGFPAAASISGQYVSKVEIAAGVVSAEFGNKAISALSGNRLVMVPEVNAGALTWRCSYTDASGYRYVPSVCRSSP